MKNVTKYNHTDFTVNELAALKGDKKIYVVFSTFGEREADLVIEKIGVLKKSAGTIIDRIIINHRRAGKDRDRTESGITSAFDDVSIMVSNNVSVPDMDMEKGKGADMRRTIYRINREFLDGSDTDDAVVVFLDADVLPQFFGAHFVTGLAGAVLKGADYAKGGFWREMGRVKKYVAQPLFSVVCHPDLALLSEFSYPLSGECAGTLDFFNSVSFWQMYGVETGVLIDAVTGDYNLADVNLGLYDHEHHSDMNIQKMSFGIIRTYLRSLIDYGIISLNRDAALSDIFSAAYINAAGERITISENLHEKKYIPLREIL